MYIKLLYKKQKERDCSCSSLQTKHEINQLFKRKYYSLNKYEILFKLHRKSHFIVDIACHDEIT